MLYVLDTSSLRVLANYFPDRFPSVWEHIEELVADGCLLSVREVYRELEAWGGAPEWLREWVEKNKEIFVPAGSEDAAHVTAIFAVPHFRNMVSERQRLKGTPVADPFVVACARARGGCVVTEEENRPNSAKIPNVCEHFGVECTDIEGMMAQLGWQF